ncbi:hypothetical protein GV829_10120 [Sphingomonas lacunae]|uniref:AtpZ/AtpI family protein n=1 Tax=Sphingomonas lacunae TaxID=2698828 RepID=A0A6M4AUI6_9SPHN|nr:hypothetical protein [Sphingomonas lacunae]QJQ32753.1 hypothetical protein GV829_10120 [Sphingomonas lacunae]
MIEGLEEQLGESDGTAGDGPSLLTVLAWVQLLIGLLVGLGFLLAGEGGFKLFGLVSLFVGLSGFAVFRGFNRVIELLQRISEK